MEEKETERRRKKKKRRKKKMMMKQALENMKKKKPQNRKIYKKRCADRRTQTLQEGHTCGWCLDVFFFDGWPSNHRKNSVFRARPEEHPRNAQFIKIHKNPRRGLSKYPCFSIGDNERPRNPYFYSVSWGREKWGSIIHPQNCQQWGSLTHP